MKDTLEHSKTPNESFSQEKRTDLTLMMLNKYQDINIRYTISSTDA